MNRLRFTCALIVGLSATLFADDEKVRTPKQIMTSTHSFKGLLKQTENGANAKEPNWDDLQKVTAQYAKETAELGKTKSPKPDHDKLWKELTDKLAESGKAVEAAAKKKDAEALQKATKAIRSEQCAKCHDTFRGE